MTITRIDPMSAGKVLGALGVLLGLVIGAFVTLAGMLLGGLSAGATDEPGAGFVGMIFGVGAIVILPIFYGCAMFIGGLLQAFLYNLAAGFTGGIEVDTK